MPGGPVAAGVGIGAKCTWHFDDPMNKDHAIVVPGLEHIFKHGSNLIHCLQISALCGFISVLPLGMAYTFELQEMKDNSTKGEWAG